MCSGALQPPAHISLLCLYSTVLYYTVQYSTVAASSPHLSVCAPLAPTQSSLQYSTLHHSHGHSAAITTSEETGAKCIEDYNLPLLCLLS